MPAVCRFPEKPGGVSGTSARRTTLWGGYGDPELSQG
jgi:hypothetical protein